MTAKLRHTHPYPMYTDTALFKIVSVIDQKVYKHPVSVLNEKLQSGLPSHKGH